MVTESDQLSLSTQELQVLSELDRLFWNLECFYFFVMKFIYIKKNTFYFNLFTYPVVNLDFCKSLLRNVPKRRR